MTALDIDAGQAYEAHPVADLFPMLADDELAELASDIQERGQLQPIVLDAKGRVLDGRNRLQACRLAGVEPVFTTYDGDDPDGYALAVNGQRRSMSKGQKALVGAELLLSNKDQTQDSVASALGVSRPLITQAVEILTWARDQVAGIMLTGSGWAEARQLAATRRESDEIAQAKLKRLEADAFDLAEQVRDKGLSLDDAIAALESREAKALADEQARRSAEEAERHEREQAEAMARQQALNEYQKAFDGLTTALSYTRAFTPPEAIPPSYPPLAEFVKRSKELTETTDMWEATDGD